MRAPRKKLHENYFSVQQKNGRGTEVGEMQKRVSSPENLTRQDLIKRPIKWTIIYGNFVSYSCIEIQDKSIKTKDRKFAYCLFEKLD